jgi:hypothetical protein
VSLSGQKVARGHLRVAYTPPREGASDSRVALLLRSMLVFLRIAWVNLVAVIGVIAALAPLLHRRRPVGMRTTAIRPQPARVIPFAGRRAQNR